MAFTLVAVLVALASTVQPSSPAPAKNCRAVKGAFVAKLVQPPACPEGSVCTAGKLTGGLTGTYEFHVTKAPVEAGAPAPPTVRFFVGQSTVTLKNGDVLIGTDTGTIDMPPGLGGFASLITWTEARGKITNAGGQIRLRGILDPATGTSGDYEGNVCGDPSPGR